MKKMFQHLVTIITTLLFWIVSLSSVLGWGLLLFYFLYPDFVLNMKEKLFEVAEIFYIIYCLY